MAEENDSFYLTNEPRTIAQIQAALAEQYGIVIVTSRLAMDLLDSDDGVECFTIKADGTQGTVKEFSGSEWDIELLRLAASSRYTAIVEVEDVQGASTHLGCLLATGITVGEAVATMLPV